MSQSGEAVPAEVALENPAVLGAVEECAPLLELPHAIGRFLGVQFGHAVVVEVLAAAHGVAEVDHPVVFGVHVAHRGGHAAFGHDGVGLSQQRLGNDADAQSSLLGFDGGA